MVNQMSRSRRREAVPMRLPQAATTTIDEIIDQLEDHRRKSSRSQAVETALRYAQKALDRGVDVVAESL